MRRRWMQSRSTCLPPPAPTELAVAGSELQPPQTKIVEPMMTAIKASLDMWASKERAVVRLSDGRAAGENRLRVPTAR